MTITTGHGGQIDIESHPTTTESSSKPISRGNLDFQLRIWRTIPSMAVHNHAYELKLNAILNSKDSAFVSLL